MAVLDVVEEILSRSDAEDLIQWKRVCKSWYSLISSPSFVKLHLKISGNNRRHLRIMMPLYSKAVDKKSNESLYEYNFWKVIGSSNGLVCFSRIQKDALTVLFNPWTREVTKLPMAPLLPAKVSGFLTLGFGYDSYTDDYKVVMAIHTNFCESLVQVLSLKSNTWKLIGQFDYVFCHNKPVILFNGALHWYVFDYHDNACKSSNKVILSFDLSREEFTLFPEPNDKIYDSCFTTLGILEDQLCIFSHHIPNDNAFPRDIWVMRSYNVKDSWELLSHDCEINYEVIHYMNILDCYSSKKTTTSFFSNHNNKFSSRDSKYLSAPKFVPSLVSPLYVHTGRPSQPKNSKSIEMWSAEVSEGECPHVQTKRRKFVKADDEENRGIEEFYRREVGETENLYLHEDGETKIEIEESGSHTLFVQKEGICSSCVGCCSLSSRVVGGGNGGRDALFLFSSGNENLLMSSSVDPIVGSITGSTTMINLLNTPLLHQLFAADNDISNGNMSAIEVRESICVESRVCCIISCS